MTKIRKQPRRSTKKRIERTITNPFFQNPIPSFVPIKIAESIVSIEKISFQQLDEFVQSYNLIKGQVQKIDFNVRNMKEAVLQQQLKIEELRMIAKTQDTHHERSQSTNMNQGQQLRKTKRKISKSGLSCKLSEILSRNQKDKTSKANIHSILTQRISFQQADNSSSQMQKIDDENPENNEKACNQFQNQQYYGRNQNLYSFYEAKNVWDDHNECQIPVNIEHQESQSQLLRMPHKLQQQNQEYHIK